MPSLSVVPISRPSLVELMRRAGVAEAEVYIVLYHQKLQPYAQFVATAQSYSETIVAARSAPQLLVVPRFAEHILREVALEHNLSIITASSLALVLRRMKRVTSQAKHNSE